jgi:hypothetical protein
MPLYQDFLAGGFYAIKRHAVAELLAGAGYDGLPVGVTGDDSFLDHLVGADRLLLSESRSAYEPPNFSDFCLYLARIRWQNEQLALLLSAPASDGPQAGTVSRVIGKVRRSGRPLRMVGALASVALKRVFVLIAAPQIDRVYRKLGVVGIDGAGLLGRATRSESTK